jgi:hypothetical protein
MIDFPQVPVLLGGVVVKTTEGRGFTPEELASDAVDKIVYVGSQSHPVIREQAEAFKKHIHSVVLAYMKQAVVSHNTTIANRLKDAGHHELVALLNN